MLRNGNEKCSSTFGRTDQRGGRNGLYFQCRKRRFCQIQVFFKQGIDPDIAAVNVQNRVARATPFLPSEVTRSGVVTQKQQTSALMYMSFYSENKDLDDVYLQNF
jgi:multidrug efflux pump subunit AcrB